MALDARTRSSLYGKFAEILGDDDANSLMSEFPSVEAEELVTKQFLRAELGLTRSDLIGEIGAVRAELLDEIGSVRSDLGRTESGLRSELAQAESGLRGELAQAESRLVGNLANLRDDMGERLHRQTLWLAGTVVATAGAVIAAVPLLS